jgi:outer membrane protein assembly factor BamB
MPATFARRRMRRWASCWKKGFVSWPVTVFTASEIIDASKNMNPKRLRPANEAGWTCSQALQQFGFYGDRQPSTLQTAPLSAPHLLPESDMAGSPVIYNNSSGRVIAVGGKTGSFFLLRANDLSPISRRQLLPYLYATQNDPETGKDPIPITAISNPNVGGASDFGIFSAAAVDFANRRLFVSIGAPGAFDFQSTPLVRALDWDTLEDAWPTEIPSEPEQLNGQIGYLVKYNVANSPFYAEEEGTDGSSPAVSNGVVLVTTRLPALYAFDAITGECLWSDKTTIIGTDRTNLGPAILGDLVVVAGGQKLFRWKATATVVPPPVFDPSAVLSLLL